jgi:hypothetical protein
MLTPEVSVPALTVTVFPPVMSPLEPEGCADDVAGTAAGTVLDEPFVRPREPQPTRRKILASKQQEPNRKTSTSEVNIEMLLVRCSVVLGVNTPVDYV